MSADLDEEEAAYLAEYNSVYDRVRSDEMTYEEFEGWVFEKIMETHPTRH